jgi:hypothetical protein
MSTSLILTIVFGICFAGSALLLPFQIFRALRRMRRYGLGRAFRF